MSDGDHSCVNYHGTGTNQTRDLVAKISQIVAKFHSAVDKHCYENLQLSMRFLQPNLWSAHESHE